MRRLGVLGGMSWESTAVYYRLLNEGVRDALGGLHSAPLLLDSVDFATIESMQREGRWDDAGAALAEAAAGLERSGATAILLATNTMHKVAAAVEAAVGVPLLHVGDAVGERLTADGVERTALLGTRFTMQEPFYRDRLAERFGIDVVVPPHDVQRELDRVIFDELCLGRVLPSARATYLDALHALHEDGAQAAVLGCTEIGMLLTDGDGPLPLVDSTVEHVALGLRWMLDA